MRRISLLLVLLVCLIAAAPAQDFTEGTLAAYGKRAAPLGACPLKNTTVKAEISGFMSRVRVVQEFENNFGEAIEAVYVFPLPERAAVDEMTMRIGSRLIRGKIMKREEARAAYETARSEGKTASLLDQERPNIFTQSVANIPPGEKIFIEISYVAALKYEDGAYEFVFPMTVGARYNPASVADAEKISPPTVTGAARAGHDISIEVKLNAGVPVEEIRSKTHEIQTANLNASSALVRLKNDVTIPNRDFILRYDVSGKRIEDAVLTHRDGRDGFFTLILQPPDRVAVEDVAPKEIVFVLDTSGSMSGFPIEKAKEAMILSLDGLYPNDTFNLITFAGDTEILFDAPVPATPANIERARRFLESRSGAGGTEMMKAIKAALAPSSSQEHIRIVCFMTDGHVGNETEIISEVKRHPKARVFSFGIGDSVNRFLLEKIAEEGRGEAEFVSLQDDGSGAARRFYERVRTPILTDVSIDWNGLPVTNVYPTRSPDLFSAKPVVIFGRYAGAASGTIRLQGKIGGQEYVREIAVNLPESQAENDALAKLWARARIDDLLSQSYRFSPADDEFVLNVRPAIKTAITQLGLKYELLTEYTSFVAVEEKIVNQRGKPRTIRVPVYAPAGTEPEEDSEDSQMQAMGQVSTRNVRRAKIGSGTGGGRGSGSGGGIGRGSGGGIGNGIGPVLLSTPPPPNSQTVSTSLPKYLPKVISGGVVNGSAVNLPQPEYPPAARAVRASGTVSVQVTVDEQGNVISANAVGGHPLLRQAAVEAARQARFRPTMLSGQPVKTTGVIAYNFTAGNNSATVNAGETTPQSEEQTPPAPLTPEERRRQWIDEKFHLWLAALVDRLEKNIAEAGAHEAKFVRDGKAEIQLHLTEKTPEVLAALRSAGVEITAEKDAKTVTGRIALEKLSALAEVKQVRYVLPNLK